MRATRRRCSAKVGETVAFHVFALDDDFHTFHLHGHRWIDPDGGLLIDNKTLGRATSSRCSSWRTTRVAGSTTATCSPTCTWG